MSSEERDIPVDASYEEYDYDQNDDDERLTYTSGQSLASSATRYIYENGRRYHSFRDGSYYAPNDDRYSSYETIVHHLWLLTLDDKLYLAPIENPKLILDVGTGTGLWAIDMADTFLDAEIIGTDLSPTQDTSAPPNIRFEIDDCCSEWTYPENSFCFVHMRGLTGCISDWPMLYQQAFKHIKPGGYLEHLEFSVVTNADPNSDDPGDRLYTTFSNGILEGGRQMGRPFDIDVHMAEHFRNTGFEDVTEHKFIWPIGPWPSDPKLKERGRWGQRNWEDGIEGWVMALYTRNLGWTYAQVQRFIEDIKKAIRDRTKHMFHEVRCVYGRKPLTPGPSTAETS